MLAVVISDLMLAAGIETNRLARRSRHHRDWGRLHSLSEKRLLADLARTRAEIARCKDPAAVRARWRKSGFPPEDLNLFIRDDQRLIRRAEALERTIAYHARMRRRFEAAAWRPWLRVEQEEMPDWYR